MQASAEITLVGAAPFRSFRNLWLLEELGVPYEHIPALPRSEEAQQFSPLGKIPVLKHGDLVMFESAGINTYLADLFRGRPDVPKLIPEPGSLERGLYEQWVSFIVAEVDSQALWIHRKHEALPVQKPEAGFPAIPEAVTHARAHFDRVMRVLAQGIRGKYLLGDQFSAADVLLVHCMNWAEAIGWGTMWTTPSSPEGECLSSYAEACRGRDAYQTVRGMTIIKA